MSVRSFLASSKQLLQKTIREKGQARFVIGNESADLDSITCALVYAYLQSNQAQAQNPTSVLVPVCNIPASDLSLRPELTTLLKHAEIQPSELITLDDLGKDFLPTEHTEWTLVDHNGFQGELGKAYSERVRGVIDHHDDEHKVPKDAAPRIIEKTGSCCSHVTNYCCKVWDASSERISSLSEDGDADVALWDAQVARLALGSILIDTVNMTAEAKITKHDHKAVDYLEAKIRSCLGTGETYNRDSFFTQIDDAKSNIDGLSIVDILRKDYKQWTEGGLTLGIASVVQGVEYLQGRDQQLIKTCADFARQRSLQLFGMMTAFTNKDNEFARELLLVVPEMGKGVEAAERFVTKSQAELQLHQVNSIGGQELAFVRLWEARNLKASRKQVAPLLRQAMLGGEESGKL